MGKESIRPLPGNKTENCANRREQCGAIEQPRDIAACPNNERCEEGGFSLVSALARLEAPLRFVNHIDAALAPHEAVVAVTAAQGFQ
jgi:hypothetical protein